MGGGPMCELQAESTSRGPESAVSSTHRLQFSHAHPLASSLFFFAVPPFGAFIAVANTAAPPDVTVMLPLPLPSRRPQTTWPTKRDTAKQRLPRRQKSQ